MKFLLILAGQRNARAMMINKEINPNAVQNPSKSWAPFSVIPSRAIFRNLFETEKPWLLARSTLPQNSCCGGDGIGFALVVEMHQLCLRVKTGQPRMNFYPVIQSKVRAKNRVDHQIHKASA